ncbi:MAG: hypothetical protein C4524_00355 [Candidatus Zixiibacteriota bacterium]|nr:MAG: hypothetical protein C4524_00355 [candidate division Zixibacteria bacterium]
MFEHPQHSPFVFSMRFAVYRSRLSLMGFGMGFPVDRLAMRGGHGLLVPVRGLRFVLGGVNRRAAVRVFSEKRSRGQQNQAHYQQR